MMLVSSIVVGAVAMSRHNGIRWGIILKLIDLDLRGYDMCSNLLDLWSMGEFVELVESNGYIGTWSLVDWLVSHHAKCLL